jgi:hypothetical protein
LVSRIMVGFAVLARQKHFPSQVFRLSWHSSSLAVR